MAWPLVLLEVSQRFSRRLSWGLRRRHIRWFPLGGSVGGVGAGLVEGFVKDSFGGSVGGSVGCSVGGSVDSSVGGLSGKLSWLSGRFRLRGHASTVALLAVQSLTRSAVQLVVRFGAL